MGAAEMFRRAFHVASPVWLSYYLLPPDSYVGIKREFLVIAVLAVVFSVEAARLAWGLNVPGIREYERRRPAAYAVGGLGVGLGLLFFPMPITIVTVCGMAWIDPVCGATKRTRLYPAVPLITYLLMAVTLLLLAGYSPALAVLLAAAGSAVAVASERPRLRVIDDDFLMVAVPLVTLGGIDYLTAVLLP